MNSGSRIQIWLLSLEITYDILYDSQSISTALQGGFLCAAILKAQKALETRVFGWQQVHRGQTSEAFFVLFSRILFNVKLKHGQGGIK